MKQKETPKEVEEEIAEAEEPKKVNDIVVVLEALPSIQTRTVVDEKGNEFQAITRDEALSEILATVRQLKKGLL